MSPQSEARFCLRCGHALERRFVFGAERPACPACGRVHFFDPKVAVGVLVERAGRVLLIRRGVNPERGKWSVPAGYMDAGEDPAAAAAREALEETGMRVVITGLLDVFPRAGGHEGADLLLIYRAEAPAGEPQAGDDAEAAGFFAPDELPELAFTSSRRVVARWLAGAGK